MDIDYEIINDFSQNYGTESDDQPSLPTKNDIAPLSGQVPTDVMNLITEIEKNVTYCQQIYSGIEQTLQQIGVQVQMPQSSFNAFGLPSRQGIAMKRFRWDSEEHFNAIREREHSESRSIQEVAQKIGSSRTVQQIKSHFYKYDNSMLKVYNEALEQAKLRLDEVYPQIQHNVQIANERLALEFPRRREMSLEFLFLELFKGNIDRRYTLEEKNNLFMVIRPLFEKDLGRPFNKIYIPLTVVSKAFVQLREIFGESVLHEEAPPLDESDPINAIMRAIAGKYRATQPISQFAECEYDTETNEILIDEATPDEKLNTVMFLDNQEVRPDSAKCLKFNVRQFVPHFAAYLSARVANKQFLEDFIFTVTGGIAHIAACKDPVDYVFHNIAKMIRHTEEDVCLYILCHQALYACYQCLKKQ